MPPPLDAGEVTIRQQKVSTTPDVGGSAAADIGNESDRYPADSATTDARR
jgi:hypothetical protein